MVSLDRGNRPSPSFSAPLQPAIRRDVGLRPGNSLPLGRLPRFLMMAGVLVAGLLLGTGCTPRAVDPPRTVARPAAELRDNLTLALEYLNRTDVLNPDETRLQSSYHLNRWVERQKPDAGWIADGLFARVRERTAGPHTAKTLAALEFHSYDVRYLEQAQWARQVAVRAADEPLPEPLREWINQEVDRTGNTELELLASAANLLDWTVRNVQLEPLAEYPVDKVAAPGSEGEQAPPPPRLAVKGPGYQRMPWQIMLFGKGDAWERARVFILLCRQLRLDAVMLALNDNNRNPTPYPWLPAVMLNKQLYLFDTQLGLPIPAAGGRGIATLEQVIESPQLLTALNIGDDFKYAVGKADLDKVVALVDASPFALSQRMRLIESNLDAEHLMVLTASPSRLAKRLMEFKGVTATRLWEVSFEAEMYRIGLEEVTQNDAERWHEMFREEMIFHSAHPLLTGRVQMLAGNFDKTEDDRGAKGWLLMARQPNAVIGSVKTDQKSQERLGLKGKLPDNQREREMILDNSEVFFTRSKLNASYWLGLAQYETGQYTAAVEWFKKRTLETSPDGPWTHAARYNLARTYEALGEPEKARELYLADDSPQRHGNLLRARQLREAGATTTSE